MNYRYFVTLFLLFLTFGVGSLTEAASSNDVEVLKGPTPIPNGDAVGQTDITVQNGLFALSFSVESQPPWGVARGGILDLALIDGDGNYSDDLVSLIDFMPDSWSSWPTTYQDVTVVEEAADRVVIRVKRDWHDVELETTFTIERGKSTVHIHTDMTNHGDQPREDILSGYVLWADGGYFFNRPGLDGLNPGEADRAFTDWTASYEKDWSLVFHAPFATHIDYGGQDQYRQHTLNPGDTASFEGWLQVILDGNIGPALGFEAERKQLKTGTVHGSVQTRTGDTVSESILLVKKAGQVYTWFTADDGKFKATLPAGEYKLSAIAEHYSESSSTEVNVEYDERVELNFDDLEEPGEIEFSVASADDEQSIDAQVKILEGQTSPVEYLGRSMMFTDLDQKGELSIQIAPGDYMFEIGSGAGFVSSQIEERTTITSGESVGMDISIPIDFSPSEHGWFGADLHHHSDVLDGSTPPKLVLQAQLAAGLDLVFLSDHDSGRNHSVMDSLTSARDIPFIPSMEISPSWGHFNVFPLELGAELSVDPSEATATEIFEDAKNMGADVVSVNHPYISYGWFHSLEEGTAAGSFDPGFDLVELNIGDDFSKIFKRLYSFWNDGLEVYLAAGSDTHDVWTGSTGRIRMMVHVPGGVSVDGYVQGLRRGNAYATTGPLIIPEQMFGEQVRIRSGEELTLRFEVMSVNGLYEATLTGNGEKIDLRNWETQGASAELSFDVAPTEAGWYSIIVEDGAGEKAYSNPIWVTPVEGEF